MDVSALDLDDYLRETYHGDDSRQYELEHQHSTTVHGEDELFDDTDRREDNRVSLENAVIEHLGIDPQGAQALRRSLGHLEQSAELHADESDEGRAPEHPADGTGTGTGTAAAASSSPRRTRFSPLTSPTTTVAPPPPAPPLPLPLLHPHDRLGGGRRSESDGPPLRPH
ncbi:hypothetical protein MYCTH_2305447 [Thermothelomyces thermophilus ATCC 42464]|uniref:Uncharacterized protein n=1 Tax=Thermothelomyces thermophilus (strain ATCC 42464 / BCRC 31852 / DSM 1799) TaxID=573729 RepID=G2QD30_THET4|nr:uncharacterized protein MYCTH_2305447 [Thermothelomyces thermophilus ATCC 42464]AEO58248.1 hypothetical protein MYCTH_2305447 [Thermothelomyces thermophilus ATCC 42464]